MIIRQQQMTTLSDVALRSFEDRVAAHLNRCFPDDCRALGPTGVQEIIRYGTRRAESHGIDLERDVCKYIDLMFSFGRDFDSSPDHPWASRILQDETINNSTIKTERL